LGEFVGVTTFSSYAAIVVLLDGMPDLNALAFNVCDVETVTLLPDAIDESD
jgi:hypothetical protein